MSSADWEEVKRLAQDFQRAQLTSANQRLTERNCVEIVTKLIELKLLDVVFTTDGKEYVTPQQLNREIQDELYVHGGRLSLTELTQLLNISLSVVEARAQEIVRADKSVSLVLGQLITTSYLDLLVEELNEKLKQEGSVSISELSKTSDLPGDFLQQNVERRLGRIIFGTQDEQDSSVIYTETFVRRNTCKIRGILSAITKPTPFGNILNKFQSQIPERLFFAIVNKLIKSKRIDGVITGSGNRSSYYIPSSYSRAQSQWIEGFMNGNGYVDLDAASRLGISDPRAFIGKHYPGSVFLKSYCLGELIFKQAKESIEESLETSGWVDVLSVLPLSISDDDTKILLKLISPSENDTMVFDSVIVNRSLVRTLRNSFKTLMEEKAVKEVQSGTYIQLVNELRAQEKKLRMAELNAEGDAGRSSKKEDRRKKATGGKGGGGTQGRETKTKSTKKKYMAGKKDGFDSDSEDEKPVKSSKNQNQSGGDLGGGAKGKEVHSKTLPFLSLPEIRKHLKNADGLNESPEELIESLASYLHRFLTDDYQLVLKEEFDRFMADKCGRKSREEVHQKLLGMMALFNFYSDGLTYFDSDVKGQLEKHLLRTFGQEVVGNATAFALLEAGFDENAQACDLPSGPVKDALLSLGKSPTIEAFLEAYNTILPPKKNATMKSPPSLLLIEARESLLEEMEAATETEPALFLHVATLILFSVTTGSLLQASGKFVPQIIHFLTSKLSKEEASQLREYQDAVVQFIKSKSQVSTETLKDMYPNLKALVSAKSKEVPAGGSDANKVKQ